MIVECRSMVGLMNFLSRKKCCCSKYVQPWHHLGVVRNKEFRPPESKFTLFTRFPGNSWVQKSSRSTNLEDEQFVAASGHQEFLLSSFHFSFSEIRTSFLILQSFAFLTFKKWFIGGLPWRSSGYNSSLPMQRAWILSLVGEIRSHMPCDVAKNIFKKTDLQLGFSWLTGDEQKCHFWYNVYRDTFELIWGKYIAKDLALWRK